MTSNLTLPAVPEAGAEARKALVRWLGGHPRLDDALLAMTELVNNAVVHGGLRPEEKLTITMRARGEGVRLAVRHPGVLFQPHQSQVLSADPGASRGLGIVERIADVWGVDSNGAEVSAWFEVTTDVSDGGGR